MTVSLESTGKGSSLENATLTAPGSAAAVSPLPPEVLALLAAADPNGTSGVAFQLTSTAFDPYVDAPLGDGITRVAFAAGADGSPVEVAGLAMPISFELPLVAAAGGDGGAQQGVCSFWDAARGAYRCVLLRPSLCSRSQQPAGALRSTE